jgi:protein subunit release factor A
MTSANAPRCPTSPITGRPALNQQKEINVIEQQQTNESTEGRSELSGLVISPADIEVRTWPEPPSGGMQTGESCNGVVVHHRPTGIMVARYLHREQHLNKRDAIDVLQYLLRKIGAI